MGKGTNYRSILGPKALFAQIVECYPQGVVVTLVFEVTIGRKTSITHFSLNINIYYVTLLQIK